MRMVPRPQHEAEPGKCDVDVTYLSQARCATPQEVRRVGSRAPAKAQKRAPQSKFDTASRRRVPTPPAASALLAEAFPHLEPSRRPSGRCQTHHTHNGIIWSAFVGAPVR